MNRSQREALDRIAAQLLSDRGRGRAHVGDNRAIRTLHEQGYIEVRDIAEPFGGASALRLLPVAVRLATLTDVGWAALKGEPHPEQLAFLARNRTSCCSRDWPIFRSCLARGWVEEREVDEPWNAEWRKHSVRWHRTEAGRAELRTAGISLRPQPYLTADDVLQAVASAQTIPTDAGLHL